MSTESLIKPKPNDLRVIDMRSWSRDRFRKEWLPQLEWDLADMKRDGLYEDGIAAIEELIRVMKEDDKSA